MKNIKNSKKEVELKSVKNKITVALAIFLGILVVILVISQIIPVIETARSEVKKLPKEIKKQIRQVSPSATFRVPILLYHYVEYVKDKGDTIRQSLNIEPSVLDEQVKTLKNDGYNFITVGELGAVLGGGKELPPKPVILTFDDGHWDLYTDILPVLKKYNVRATAFIVSGFIGGSDSLNKKQLEEVIGSGLVEIGAHTVHHLSLTDKLLPIVKYEILQSKKELEQNYQIKVLSFAYPNGAFDVQVAKEVKEAGFNIAVSTVPGIEVNQANRFFIYRLRPGGRVGKTLLNYLSQNSFTAY